MATFDTKGYLSSIQPYVTSANGGSATHVSNSGDTHGGHGGTISTSSSSSLFGNQKAANISNNNNNNNNNRTTTVAAAPVPDYSSGSDGILDQIKALLREQQEASKKYYETMYNQRMNEINTEANRNRDLINTNYKRGERYLNNLYGRTDSGNNWTNRARNNQNWLSQLATNRENTANLRDSAAAQRDMGLANAASTMAQGWYNYVLPVMSNRQQTLDDYNYRRYLASL